MAYQKVGTPRFYINVLEWLSSQKKRDDDSHESEYHPRYYLTEENSIYTSNIPDVLKTHPINIHEISLIGVALAHSPASTEFPHNYTMLDHGEGGNSFIAILNHTFGSGEKIKYTLDGINR